MDMANCSYDDWLRFTFEQPATGDKVYEYSIGDRQSWWDSDLVAAAPILLAHCTRLFRSPAFLLERYDRKRLSQVLWALPGIDGYLGILNFDPVPWPARAECIASFYDLYRDLFAKDRLDGAGFMWWEHLIGANWQGSPPVMKNPALCILVYEVLERILTLPEEWCQYSALHGISEFLDDSRSGRAQQIVQPYLARTPNLAPDLRTYALDAQFGNVQ